MRARRRASAGGEGQEEEGEAEKERERRLARHRNCFANVARPMLAFAQPVPCEVFGASPRQPGGFTLWDSLSVAQPGGGGDGGRAEGALGLDQLRVRDVDAFLKVFIHTHVNFSMPVKGQNCRNGRLGLGLG